MDPEVVSYRSTPPAPTPDKATSRWERFCAKHALVSRMLIGAALLSAVATGIFAAVYVLGHLWLLILPGPDSLMFRGFLALFCLIAIPFLCLLYGTLILPLPETPES